MSARCPLTTRRTAVAGALAGAAGLAGLTGCDLVGGERPSSSSTPGAAVARSSDAGGPNPDEKLVADLRAELASVLALVNEVRRRTPRLRQALNPLVRMHQAHFDVLSDVAVSGRSPGSAPPRRATGAPLARVRAREATTQQRLDEWALQARSGALAQLLASMSASVAQHRVVLSGMGGGSS